MASSLPARLRRLLRWWTRNPGAWQYIRRREVGVTLAIQSGHRSRWEATRDVGHQVTAADVDGQTRGVMFDALGRVQTDDGISYRWHPVGSLAAAEPASGTPEYYGYDADGRIIAIWSGEPRGLPSQTLLHERDQIAAIVSGSRSSGEAAWGPRQDQLVEWTDQKNGHIQVHALITEGTSLAWCRRPAS